MLHDPYRVLRYSYGVLRDSNGVLREGTPRTGPANPPSGYRYTGQRWEGGIDLYWYGSRWYDDLLGRFIQPDPYVPESKGVLAFDRYAYSNNNPIRYSDPSGHSAWDSIGDFATGFVYELARTTAWYSSHAQNVLSVNATESDAMLAGRVLADVATIAVGVAEVAGGIAFGTGGTAIACVTTLCIRSVATVGAAVVVAGAGATTAMSGASGLGGNLARISG